MAKTKSGSAEPKTRKPKGSKAKKDPDAPKKAQSAYMIFCNEQRPVVKEENPEATFGEMGKLLGARWKELNEDDKKPYAAKAEEDKVRYAKADAAYKSKGSAAPADDDEDDE